MASNISFSDLVPGNAAAPAETGAGVPIAFDDLIPGNNQSAAPALQNQTSDALKGFASGVAQGGIGVAGIPGDFGSLVSAGVDKLGNALGIDPQKVAAFKANEKASLSLNPLTAPFANAPTSQQITNAAQDLTGQKLYQAQTVPGQYAQTIGQFVPAMIGGPESLASKALTRVIAPAVASEGAGQLTSGTPLEPIARVAGALAGGVGASSAMSKLTAPALQAIPSVSDLSNAAKQLYQSPEIAAVQFKPAAMQAFTVGVDQQLLNNKVDKFIAPTVMGIVDRLTQPRFGGSGTISDFDLARQSLSNVPPGEGRAAGIVRNAIDNYLGNIPQNDLLGGNAAAANKTLLAARANTAAAKRAQDVENALGRAENQAGSTYSGANMENATRQQLRPILNQKQGVSKVPAFQDYTPDEIAALKTAVNGTTFGNIVRRGAKYLGGGGGLGALAAVGTSAAAAHEAGYDPLESLGIGLMMGLAGHGLNRYGAALTERNGRAVSELLRSRSPLGAPIAAANKGLLANQLPTLPPPAALGLQGLLASRYYLPSNPSR